MSCLAQLVGVAGLLAEDFPVACIIFHATEPTNPHLNSDYKAAPFPKRMRALQPASQPSTSSFTPCRIVGRPPHDVRIAP